MKEENPWQQLYQSIEKCENCSLGAGCLHKVPGQGDLHAPLMIIGEGPGQQEDEQGLAFVGPAGQLLTRMLQAIALQPENITVHTLTLKRASRIVIEDQKENDYADVAAMLEKCHLLAEAGYRPYYLYRQKNTLQNLENVGWCKPGHEGYYNIYIMEEVQTILSAGAGGSTKLVADGGKRMQRIFNFKYPNEYIQRFAEVLDRKKGVAEFYDHDLGTETTG